MMKLPDNLLLEVTSNFDFFIVMAAHIARKWMLKPPIEKAMDGKVNEKLVER